MRPHAVAHAVEQILRRQRAMADRGQLDGNRLRGPGVYAAHDGAPPRVVAEEPAAGLGGFVDRSQVPQDHRVSLRCSPRGGGWSDAQSVRSKVRWTQYL